MTNGAAAGAAGGAGAAAAVANAIKASGAIVQVEPVDFLNILAGVENPLVVYSEAGFLRPYKYLTSYRGLCFYAKSKEPLNIRVQVELVHAKSIWMPG